MNKEEIIAFLQSKDYDVRKSGDARWIDQKCTPDVVCLIADCIVNYSENNTEETFTSRDIRFSSYAVENVQSIFRKVDVESEMADNEYDKFFQQPMKLLSYAGILKEDKIGRTNHYKILNKDLLKFVALRERNALLFLIIYIEKVLLDSNLKELFDNFLTMQNKDSFELLKQGFVSFTKRFTSIGNKTSEGGRYENAGVVECSRIFTKIINPLSFAYNKKGSIRGHLSKHNITYDLLMYNRDNFRDIYAEKPKGMSRKDYIARSGIVINIAYYKYQSVKAKKELRRYNETFRNGLSEILENGDKATQMHHIFLESEFPEISAYLENIIALTPTQHFNYAHPMGNTQRVDRPYQIKCLQAKSNSIQDNFATDNVIYNFQNFLFVLTTGFSDESYLQIEDNDFDGINSKLLLAQ